MWLSKLRQRRARYFVMTAIAATSAALIAIGLAMHSRNNAPLDALFDATAYACRIGVRACAKRDAHGDERHGATLAALSDRFVYRPWISLPDPRQGYGNTLTVGKGKDFPSIARAVRAAQDGDIIAIAPGTYVGESSLLLSPFACRLCASSTISTPNHCG